MSLTCTLRPRQAWKMVAFWHTGNTTLLCCAGEAPRWEEGHEDSTVVILVRTHSGGTRHALNVWNPVNNRLGWVLFPLLFHEGHRLSDMKCYIWVQVSGKWPSQL